MIVVEEGETVADGARLLAADLVETLRKLFDVECTAREGIEGEHDVGRPQWGGHVRRGPQGYVHACTSLKGRYRRL